MITIERFWWFVKSVHVASFFQSFAPDNIATLQQACLLYCQCGLRYKGKSFLKVAVSFVSTQWWSNLNFFGFSTFLTYI